MQMCLPRRTWKSQEARARQGQLRGRWLGNRKRQIGEKGNRWRHHKWFQGQRRRLLNLREEGGRRGRWSAGPRPERGGPAAEGSGTVYHPSTQMRRSPLPSSLTLSLSFRCMPVSVRYTRYHCGIHRKKKIIIVVPLTFFFFFFW